MACTNCFSGCVDTTSDKCVKYTGSDIEFLNIHTGDSLETVEKAITDYLATVYNAMGIYPTIESSYICDIVKQYLPCDQCGDPTLVDILTAIIRAICDLETALAVEKARIDVIEDTYSVDCLIGGGLANAGTHTVLEAVIVKLCEAVDDIATLENLLQQYVLISDINTYIQNYIASSGSSLMSAKMVPYVIYPFYPMGTFMTGLFDATGAGLGTWAKIYLCNGENGTPDLRGRSLIGTTSGVAGGAFDTAVDPGLGNPTYVLGTKNGENNIILTPAQLAHHTHSAVATVTDPGHFTTIKDIYFSETSCSLGSGYKYYPLTDIDSISSISANDPTVGPQILTTTTPDPTGITVAVVNADNVGDEGHPNVHPVLACYYIIYIP